MRAAAALLALGLALAACQPLGGGEDAPAAESGTTDALDGYVLDDGPAPDDGADQDPDSAPEEAPAEAGEADAAQPADPAPPETADIEADAPPEEGPDIFAAARVQCEEAGGIFGRAPGGANARLCFRQPEDANTPCRSGTDCEGVCLARSRTCAPIVPLLGCNEVILRSGRVATECVE